MMSESYMTSVKIMWLQKLEVKKRKEWIGTEGGREVMITSWDFFSEM